MIEGYGIDVDYDGQTLRAHGRNKMFQTALNGGAFENYRDDVVLTRDQIAGLAFKDANPLVNGNLRVTSRAGTTYQLHFRRKQAPAFRELFRELAANLEADLAETDLTDSPSDLHG